MSSLKAAIILLLLASGLARAAGDGQHASTQQSLSDGRVLANMVEQFDEFAGHNTEALLEGLRTGSSFTLTDERDADGDGWPDKVAITIDPDNGGMGYGEVFITTAIAEKLLADVGLTGTPENIAAVLYGGEVTAAEGNVVLQGLLIARDQGIAWEEIASSAGFELGELMSELEHARDARPQLDVADRGSP